jgi:hypothetical protein
MKQKLSLKEVIKAAKGNMENDIIKAIAKFEKVTGYCVDEVHVLRDESEADNIGIEVTFG